MVARLRHRVTSTEIRVRGPTLVRPRDVPNRRGLEATRVVVGCLRSKACGHTCWPIDNAFNSGDQERARCALRSHANVRHRCHHSPPPLLTLGRSVASLRYDNSHRKRKEPRPGELSGLKRARESSEHAACLRPPATRGHPSGQQPQPGESKGRRLGARVYHAGCFARSCWPCRCNGVGGRGERSAPPFPYPSTLLQHHNATHTTTQNSRWCPAP